MPNVIDEFLVAISYKVEGEAQMRDAVRTATIQARLLTDAMEKMLQGLFDMFHRVSENMDKMYFAAQRANVTVEQLREMGYAAQQAGSSLEAFQKTGEKLREMFAANPFHKQALAHMLGIDLDNKQAIKEAGGVVEYLGTAIARLYEKKPAAAMVLAQRYGFTIQQLDALRDPRHKELLAEMHELSKGPLGVNEERRSEYEFQKTRLQEIVNRIIMKFEATFIEKYAHLVNQFANFLLSHGEQIADVLAKIAAALIEVAMVIGNFALTVDHFISRTVGWKNALLIMVGGFAALLPLSIVAGLLKTISLITIPTWLLGLLGVGAGLGLAAYGAFGGGGAGNIPEGEQGATTGEGGEPISGARAGHEGDLLDWTGATSGGKPVPGAPQEEGGYAPSGGEAAPGGRYTGGMHPEGGGGGAGVAKPGTGVAGEEGPSPPASLLARAAALVNQGGSSSELQSFMAQNGYPMSGNWCGEFAASVVKAGGGKPPAGAAVASNWLNWGEHVDPQNARPGDIAVRRRSRFGGAVRPGDVGGHVGFVNSVDPSGRSFDLLGGNQGRALVPHSFNEYEIRRPRQETRIATNAPVRIETNEGVKVKTDAPVQVMAEGLKKAAIMTKTTAEASAQLNRQVKEAGLGGQSPTPIEDRETAVTTNVRVDSQKTPHSVGDKREVTPSQRVRRHMISPAY